jgi:hypothetical protein
LFISTEDIFTHDNNGKPILNHPYVEHYVFIDDFCGTGTQAKDYSKEILSKLKTSAPKILTSYLMLFSTVVGKDEVINNTLFDYVGAVQELDTTFKVFSTANRCFSSNMECINFEFVKQMCEKYGEELMYSIWKREKVPEPYLTNAAKRDKLGYKDSQLLIGFNYNTPDNTLPIIWYDDDDISWNPVFKRYNKKYGF